MANESLASSITVVERPEESRLASVLTIVNAAVADALASQISVVEHDFMADAVRTAGILLEMEGGDGTMATVPLSELGEEITLSESLEGVSELSFTRVGDGQSPLRSGHLRAPRRVRMALSRGTLGGERWWPVFDGSLRDADVDTYPCQSALQAQDGSVLDRPLIYSLIARSYWSRKDVWLDICRRNRIVPGTFNAPNNGGYVNKEITEGGNRTIRAFLAEYFVPTGYTCRWNGRSLDVVNFSVLDAPVRSLTWSDLHGMPRVTPPPANAPNVVRLASGIYPYTGPDLTGVTNTVVDTPGPYTPKAAIQKQDKVTGAITSVAPAVTAQPVLSQVATATTRDGGTVVIENIVEYGWYAPKACKNRRLTNGTITFNNQADVYKYPDNTWRTQPTETWMPLRQRYTVWSFDVNGWFLSATTRLSEITAWELNLATINNGGTGQEVNIDRLVTEDGRAWESGAEAMKWVEDISNYPSTNALGQIVQWSWSSRTSANEAFRGPVTPPPVGPVYAGPNIYVFGPLAAKRYLTRAVGAMTLWTSAQVLTPNPAGTAYTQVTTNTVNPLGFIEPVQRSVPPAAGSDSVAAPLPLREQLSNKQVPQPASVEFRDDVRIAFANQMIPAPTENAWCETLSEMNLAAFVAGQQLGASDVQFTQDLDPRIRPGVVLELPVHPELGTEVPRLLVWSSTMTLNLTDYTCEHELACKWLPRELR